jgi:hypothetical protein
MVREHQGEYDSQRAAISHIAEKIGCAAQTQGRRARHAETINGLYTAEALHRQSWKSCEAVELTTLVWVGWFNHRLLKPSCRRRRSKRPIIGNSTIPPRPRTHTKGPPR